MMTNPTHQSLPIKYWSEVHIYHVCDEYFEAILNSIRKAEKSITIESYIFAVDQLTLPIFSELKNAVERGCDVRLLVDGVGSYFWIGELKKVCAQSGVQFRVYHPLPGLVDIIRRFFWFYTFRLFRFFKKINRRNHRKITVIDGRILYLGSLNFTQVHSEKLMSERAWRDSGVELAGESVHLAIDSFRQNWFRAKRFRWSRFRLKLLRNQAYNPQNALIRINSTRFHRWKLYRDLIRRIRTSEKRIFITTAYFIPRRSFLRALTNAVKRGVDVRIIVPGISDVPLVQWAAFEIILKLLRKGVRVFEFQSRVLHAKYLVIDNWASLGSLNLNYRSFLHDLEVEAVLTDSASIENLAKQWHNDMNGSVESKIATLINFPWYKRWFFKLLFRLRFLF